MESAEVIVRIEAKIKNIKERLGFLQEENRALNEKIATLSRTLEEKETLLHKYEQNKDIGNTNNNIGSEKAKEIIEEMLREIDKCIVLLNK